jgi:hypothetical protein
MDGYFMMIGFVAGREAAPQDVVLEKIMLRVLLWQSQAPNGSRDGGSAGKLDIVQTG